MQFIVKIIERHFYILLFWSTESLKSCELLPIGTLRFGWGTFDSLRGA